MGLYNFQERFVPFIMSGAKTHTIRAERVHPDQPGNTLHLYTGLRTKKAKLLMRVPCVKIEEIHIYDVFVRDGCPSLYRCHPVVIDGLELERTEVDSLARRDGFSSFQEMMKFWNGKLPFKGNIIHWSLK